jgi:hypothetical protein
MADDEKLRAGIAVLVDILFLLSFPSLPSHFKHSLAIHLFLLTLTVRLGGIVTLMDDQVLRPVVLATAPVRVQDVLDTSGVALLGIDRGTGHVRNSGVATTPVGVLGVAERVVLGSWLREPNITAVTTELAVLERLGDILLDDDGTTGGVDEPSTYNHQHTNSAL